MLQSNLCDYSDACIVVKGTITAEGGNNRDRKNTSLAFRNSAPFISCISKINSVLIENLEDVYFVMLLYHLLEYSINYSIASGSLWNYYREELSDDINDDNGPNMIYDANKSGTKEVEIAVLLKDLDNFWKKFRYTTGQL